MAESHDWDEEEVSSDDEETKVKYLMVLTDEERISVGKESARNGEWTKITIKRNLHKSSEAEDSTLPNHDTDETVKSILKLKSTFKAETLKGITLNEPSSAPARGNKSSSASKTNSALAGKLKNVNMEDDPPLAMVGLNIFRNAIGVHYLPHSSEYVAPPSIDVVRKWFPMIGYGEEVSTKGTLRKSLLPPRGPTSNWCPTSLGVTSEERANPQLSSDLTAKVDPGLSAPNDSIPPQQGMDEGTKNTSYDHISAGTDPHVLVDQTKSVSEGLETVLTQPTTEKGASSTSIHGDKVEASGTIKLEDLAKPVSSLPTKLKDLPSKFNELTKEIKGLKTQVHEPKIKLPKELKEIPTKLEDFTKTAISLMSQVAKLKTLQWELPEEFLSLLAKVESAQAKLKTSDALPSLLLNVIKSLNKFAEVLESTSTKAGDQSVLSVGQANTIPAEGEKDANKETIS
uniref:Uncharacterized protein n=1 Tax=Tanacetum cinerariifolium TaxID=118510 RepID=A0A6L2LXA7_TANCI|nr:hypothetical protein [Tanacetum cinerariifolium]